jgi:hypothetical protein
LSVKPSTFARVASYSALFAAVLFPFLAARPTIAQDAPGENSEVLSMDKVVHKAPHAMPQFANTPAASDESVTGEAIPVQHGVGVQPQAITDDFDNNNQTAWWVYTKQSVSQVSTLITNLNARIIDINVDSATPTFTVTMVSNTGAYAKSWWWYVGVTAAQVSAQLTANNARPISLKAYNTSGGLRFAVVMVKNTGADAKGYWWYYGQSISSLSSLLTTNKARLLVVDPYTSGSSTLYTAVMIPNSGADADSWWWYVNASVSSIQTQLASNHGRIFYITAGSGGTFNVIIEGCSSGCSEWWWYVGESGTGLVNQALQNGARLVNTTTYAGCGGLCYAAAMINNSNGITTRVGNLVRNGLSGGTQGLYLKQVGGSVVANLEDGFVFDPASTLKVLINLYAMHQVQGGSVTLTTAVPHYTNGAESCPSPAVISGTEQLQVALREMMWHSDNARTAELQDYFGRSNINAYATSIGMTHTSLNGHIGCGADPRNNFTLDDGGTLYSEVANQSLLNRRNRGIFYSDMAGRAQFEAEGYDWTAVWDQDIPNIINAVAPVGTTSVQKTTYMNAMNVAYKAGNYVLCQSTCSNVLEDIAIDGWFQLPFCTASGTVYEQFVWGISFANVPTSGWFNGDNTQADKNFTTAKSELMREQIKAGMASCNGKSLKTMTYSSGSLSFPATMVGTGAANKTVSVTNNQATTVTGISISAFGDFTQANTCGTSMAAGATCTITVHFKPTATGERTGAIIIADTGVGGPQTIELSGTGN